MAQGNAIRRNFPGMTRGCSSCGEKIIVTEQMCKYGKYICSTCLSAKSVAYARRNRQKKRKWNNDYHSRISSQRATKTSEWRRQHPEKYEAHKIVQTAVRNGSLKKQPCEVCGSAKAHAHHQDYSQPLQVKWLCHEHHMESHAMLAEREKGGVG